MITRIRKDIDNKEKGFTLIELLVVIIIIGILAAIAIPLFLNQRKKAEDSAAKADVSTIGKELATWFVDNNDKPTLNVANGQYFLAEESSTSADDKIGNQSENVIPGEIVILGDDPASSWCIDVTNESGDVAKEGFKYSADGGLEEGQCSSN